MRVEYHPAIEIELREIVNYYNACSKEFGSAFLDEFEKQVLRIAAMPIIDEALSLHYICPRVGIRYDSSHGDQTSAKTP